MPDGDTPYSCISTDDGSVLEELQHFKTQMHRMRCLPQ